MVCWKINRRCLQVCAFGKQVLSFPVGFCESLVHPDQPFCDPNASYIPCECKGHQIAQLLLLGSSSSQTQNWTNEWQFFSFLIGRSVLHEREALQSTLKSYLKSISKTNSNVQGEKCESKTKTKTAFEVLCMFLNGHRKVRLEQGNRNWTTDRIRRENSLLIKKVVHYQWDPKLRCHQKYMWKRHSGI